MNQPSLLTLSPTTEPIKGQLLKWIGNKQRFANEIASYFPARINTYYEPFLGSGAVLAALAPGKGIGSDNFKPLIEIWQTLKADPTTLTQWYRERWEFFSQSADRVAAYETIKDRFNSNPNGPDLLFLCRSCYGGVVRFRKADGYMSTPCGIHSPISPASFQARATLWHQRVNNCNFQLLDYREAMAKAGRGDLIYCDPPYSFSQGILYGAQEFKLTDLFDSIEQCIRKGAYVLLSIDGQKKSGSFNCKIDIPRGLFKQEISVNCGRSMLRRFQMNGKSLDEEVVSDRLLLSY